MKVDKYASVRDLRHNPLPAPLPIVLALVFSLCLALYGVADVQGQTTATPLKMPQDSGNISTAVFPFDGAPTTWHQGYARYDFVMDTTTLKIKPFTIPTNEKFGIGAPAAGQRRCVVIVPRTPAAGQPWSWRGCYWDHQPQTEVELLKRGFHIAYISADANLRPGKEWDAWYQYLTQKHGLSKKPAFIGMSRGGEFAYTWATTHPDSVACIYADNPASSPAALSSLAGLVANDVPLLHICGSMDPLLGRYSNVIEGIYQQLGGRITVMIKEGTGHHPHSLLDPAPIADWIEQNERPVARTLPAWIGLRSNRRSFYGIQNTYREFPAEGMYITCRGATFSGTYDRYSFELDGVEGAISVIAPQSPAAGNPWVFRANFVDRDAAVDLALLAKGFHIVTGPVPYNADGPHMEHWNLVYKHLVSHGFSKKPVLEGSGRAAGEAYAWAIENPDKVSCIYAENPVLRSALSKTPIMENLAALAKAGVPILHIAGSLDPAIEENTNAAAKRYESLGGHMQVIIRQGEGHYLAATTDPAPAVDFVLAQQK